MTRLLASTIVLLLPALLHAQAVSPAPLSSGELTFAMRATKVNGFVGHVPVSRAEFHGDQLSRVTGFAEVRLVDMSTGIGLRDRHMRNAMRADSFPIIRFDLTRVEPGTPQGDSIPAVLHGRLTIHGVTHDVRVNSAVIVRGSQTEITGSFPVDMREYGIDPPSRFLGAVKVHPVTTVGVSLRFGS